MVSKIGAGLCILSVLLWPAIFYVPSYAQELLTLSVALLLIGMVVLIIFER